MMEDEKLDLGALDDLREPARFERLVGSIVPRVLAARRPPSFWEQLTAWAMPAFATAACIVLLVWGARLVLPPPPSAELAMDPGAEQSRTVLAWAAQGHAPTTEDLLLLNSKSGGARDGR